MNDERDDKTPSEVKAFVLYNKNLVLIGKNILNM